MIIDDYIVEISLTDYCSLRDQTVCVQGPEDAEKNEEDDQPAS